MNQDIMQEILKIEDEAKTIVNEARKKTELMEKEADKEIERITNELEKEYEQKVQILKVTIQKRQKEEEKKLKEEFEESRNMLGQVDPDTIVEMINLIFKRICNSSSPQKETPA